MQTKEKVLLGANSLWSLSSGMLGPLFAIFTERIGGDILDITSAWATYLIILGTLIILFGRVSDQMGERRKTQLMILGFALGALFTYGYIFIREPIHLFIIQIGLGISAALATPIWDSLYDKYSSDREGGFAWGLATGGENIFTGIAVIAGGFIVSLFSFKVLFLTMGTLQLLATLMQAQILRKFSAR